MLLARKYPNKPPIPTNIINPKRENSSITFFLL